MQSEEMNQATARDVVNGKGQGALRMKGNVNFRKAVQAHRVGGAFFLSSSSYHLHSSELRRMRSGPLCAVRLGQE